MNHNRVLPVVSRLLVLLAASIVYAGAQSPMVQVPFVTTVMGIPSSSYTGTPAGTPCASGTAGYIGSAPIANGCPGTQGLLQYPYGAAIDTAGDLVVVQAGNYGIAVLYEGGATMANLLTHALPGYTFTPTVGHQYILNTVYSSGIPLTLQSGGVYYCGNNSTHGNALDSNGDGCAAQYDYVLPRQVAFDPDGNIFFSQLNPTPICIRVLYAGGTRAANLINAYNPTVASSGGPKVGYIYALSSQSSTAGLQDFIAPRGIAVVPVSATQENVFVSDNGTSAGESGLDAVTSGTQIKEFVCPVGTTGCNTSVNGNTYTATGWATYIVGGGTTTGANGDGGLPGSATLVTPQELTGDKYGNLFFMDSGASRLRVVYNGGTTLPMFNLTTAVTTPVVGDVYTVAGGGVGHTSPAAVNTLALTSTLFGLDPAGNLYFEVDGMLWVENASSSTGQAVAIGFAGASATYFSANTSPAAGASCNGSSGPITGPTMTDAYADGCPATETALDNPENGIIPFDSQGNFYITEARTTGTAGGVLRKYSYGNNFGSQTAGTSTTTSFAFTPSISGGTTTYTPNAPTFALSDFTDAGNDACKTETGIFSTQTCVYNVTFKPSLAGARKGSMTLTQSSALDTILLSGVGSGAQISSDPGQQTVIGTGLVPAGVGVDQSGNSYISSGTAIYKSIAGGTPISFATGLVNPTQVAVDGAGNVYVADGGNNRIATVTSAGGAASAFLGGTFGLTNTSVTPNTLASTTLSNPSGVAVDQSGNVYVTDTGNNRVIEVVTSAARNATQNVLLGFSGLSSPTRLAVDAAGDVFVADSGNARIVELSAAGVQTTVSVSPSLSNPVGLAVDAAGDLYIADANNQSVVLVPNGSSTATTLLGSTTGLTGVATDSTGNVFVAASGAGGLVELNRSINSFAFTGNLAVDAASSPETLTLNNTGNINLTMGATFYSGTDTADFTAETATVKGCTSSETIAAGASCNLAVIFNPQSINLQSDTLTFPNSNAVNSPSVTLSGAANQLGLMYQLGAPGSIPNTVNTSLIATLAAPGTTPAVTGNVSFVVDSGTPVLGTITNGVATVVVNLTAGSHTALASYNGSYSTSLTFNVVTGTSSLSLSALPVNPTFGQPVVVTAATITGNSPATPTGTITFTVNNVQQTPVAYAPSVPLTLTLLPVKMNSITAAYSGDSNYAPATSTITVTVTKAPTTTAIQATPNVSISGDTITLTATVSPAFGIAPSQTVTFSCGGCNAANLPASVAVVNNQATFTTSTSNLNSYTFTASYSGDSNYLGSTATVTPQPTFVTSLSPSSLSVSQNSEGFINIILIPFFGYTGTVHLSCTSLPANTSCSPIPSIGSTLTTNGTQTLSLQITTNVSPLALQGAKLEAPNRKAHMLIVAGISLAIFFVLPIWKRRRLLSQLAFMFFLMTTAFALTSCASNTATNALYQSPIGTYTVVIEGTDGTVSNSSNLSLTVLAGTTASRPDAAY